MTSKRHNNAIRVLVNAYFNDTLAKGTCTACAVGNLVADALGAKVNKNLKCSINKMYWAKVFCTSDKYQSINEENYFGESKKQIDSTGYTWQELARIEKVFEENTIISHVDYDDYSEEEISQDKFNGLKAVFEVLCEIEGVESREYVQMLEGKF